MHEKAPLGERNLHWQTHHPLILPEPPPRSNPRPTARATACTRASRNSSTCLSFCPCSSTVSDLHTTDMLNLPRPSVATGKPQIVAAPATEPLKAYIKTLTEHAELR